MKKSIILKSALFITISSLFFSCSDDDNSTTTVSESATGALALTFDSTVGNTDFAINTPFSINGSSYSFDHLRYWVSNVQLINEDGVAYSVPQSYYLIEETGAVDIQDGTFTYPAKKRELVNINDIPAGHYTKIRFSVGVDSAYNDNMSLQAGELSQLNGMTNISWMWHTSYIFSSLTGTDASGNAIQVETGLNSNYRSIELSLTDHIHVGQTAAEINLNVDVVKILQGLNLATTPVVSASTPTEMTVVADNFKNNVFTIKSVK